MYGYDDDLSQFSRLSLISNSICLPSRAEIDRCTSGMYYFRLKTSTRFVVFQFVRLSMFTSLLPYDRGVSIYPMFKRFFERYDALVGISQKRTLAKKVDYIKNVRGHRENLSRFILWNWPRNNKPISVILANSVHAPK